MLTVRIIPCLDCKDGHVVKGVRFQNLRVTGDPRESAARYEQDGADELVVLDISATTEGRGHRLETVRSIRADLSIPLTVGGGVRSVRDCVTLLEAGADKVSVNSAAFRDPSIIGEIAGRFGSQCMVLAVDVMRTAGEKWEVVIDSGGMRTGRFVEDWVVEAVDRGVGEILLTSWDRDGTRSGYDLDLIRAVSRAVAVPIIASGGAGNAMHIAEAARAGATGLLAASILHDNDHTIGTIKQELQNYGIQVRL